MLFQVILVRQEHGQIVVASSKTFGQWNEASGDQVMAGAVSTGSCAIHT